MQASYGYSDETIALKIRRLRRSRIWMAVVLVPIAVGALIYDLYSPAGRHFSWPKTVFISCFVLLMSIVRGSRRSAELKKAYRSFHVTVTADTITMAVSPKTVKTIDRSEIVCAEKPAIGGGIYIRSTHRYRWLIVPRGIDDYAEISSALASLGIPVVRTKIPPNGEEFLFILMFCASIICDLFATSRSVLLGNVVVSGILGIFGLLVIRAGWATYQMRLKAQIGCFLPLVFALFAWFWGPFRILR